MNNQAETIQKIIDALNSSGAAAVSEYIVWHIASAIFWIAWGVFLIAASFKVKLPDSWGNDWKFILRAVVFFLGVIWIGVNYPDLFAPKAIAIHQLLKDIKG